MSQELLNFRHAELDKYMSALAYNNPAPDIQKYQSELKRTSGDLNRQMKMMISQKVERLAANINVLESVSPVQILKRAILIQPLIIK